MNKRILVVGGGIIGCLTAYYLERRGYDVCVVEQSEQLASGTTAMNGAQLSYSYVSPLGGPHLFKIMPQILMGLHPSITIKDWRNPDFWRFAGRLLGQSTPAAYRNNQKGMLDLSLRSAALMEAFLKEHEIADHFNFARKGKMYLYADSAAFEKAMRRAVDLKPYGIKQHILSRDEALEKAPLLADRRDHIIGALYAEDDHIGDAELLARYLQSNLLKNTDFKLGHAVRDLIFEGERFKKLRLNSGEEIEGDACVICCGAQAETLLRGHGRSAQIYPIKGYSVTLEGKGHLFDCSITDYSLNLLLAPLGTKLRLSGFMHCDGFSKRVPGDVRETFEKLIRHYCPDIDASSLTINSGFRPYRPNSLPLIKQSNASGLYYNIGHGMLGWTLAHASCENIANIMKQNM